MSDTPEPNTPDPHAAPEVVDDATIDAVLAEATGMAADLQTEVGTETPTPGAATPTAKDPPPEQSVEVQLERMEALLSGVQVALGDEDDEARTPDRADSEVAGSPGEPSSPTLDDASAAGSDGPPAAANGSPTVADPSRSTAGAWPIGPVEAGKDETAGVANAGVETAATDGALDASGSEKESTDEPAPAIPNTALAEERTGAADSAGPQGSRFRPGVVVRRMVLAVVDCGCALLEWVDLPFGRVGPSAREWIGWVALATLLIAAALWTACFLQ